MWILSNRYETKEKKRSLACELYTMISKYCYDDVNHGPCKSCDCYCHDLRDNKIDPRTDFFCLVCHEFFQDAISLLAHFYETPDFVQIATSQDKMFLNWYDHKQAFVKMIFMVSKLGLMEKFSLSDISFSEIDWYTRRENMVYPHYRDKKWRFMEEKVKV